MEKLEFGQSQKRESSILVRNVLDISQGISGWFSTEFLSTRGMAAPPWAGGRRGKK